jgi:3-phenylpropionate/cinnamic acid dioxygenase small subunit
MNHALVQEIEQFLYREARLLDERKFNEWLGLFTDDIRYWMPVLSTVERGEREVATGREIAHFDDNKITLGIRVRRLYTGSAHAEEPQSRTRHFVSNVEVEGEGAEITVHSNFIVYRTRLETDEDWFVGKRVDTLRKSDSGWKIAKRVMQLDQTVLNAKNLSVFF